MNYQAIIFDLDGVIVSTDRFHYRAWKTLADHLGIYFDEHINERLRGVSRMESLDIVLEKSAVPYCEGEKRVFAEEKNNLYRSYLEELTPKDLDPTVMKTMLTLRERGFKLVIGSSSKNTRYILERLGLSTFFDAVVDGNDLSKSKPDPEVFLLAAKRVGASPERCLVGEDAEAGLKAAKAARMGTAAIGYAATLRSADYDLKEFADLTRLLFRPDCRVSGLALKGILDDSVSFVLGNQLKNREHWHKFCEVFSTKEDQKDEGWRCEYFGKLMRGACLIYAYRHDLELYDILTEAVNDLLSRQEESGRISSYVEGEDLKGWDVWGRKYVLTGLLHYYDICQDGELRKKVLEACCRHVDEMMRSIGEGEGKKPIARTSDWWKGVNSCSILEAIVELYRRTGESRYWDFATYILNSGGANGANLIELALSDKECPYQYPVVKAYEVMSFFEGVLAYYELSGEKRYLQAVKNFTDAIMKTDITIIGCAGCTNELFDGSRNKQTEYSSVIMQETCVGVTWMRLNARLYGLCKDPLYLDRVELTGYNDLLGALNVEGNEQYSFELQKYMPGMAFDSYSPLYMNSRGRGIGGFKTFASGGHYGCCIAIGAAGLALMPLLSYLDDEGVCVVNYFVPGEFKIGKNEFKVVTEFPRVLKGRIEFRGRQRFRFRNPEWSFGLRLNGKEFTQAGYVDFIAEDGLEVEYIAGFRHYELNNKLAFSFGPLVLASDQLKVDYPISKPIPLSAIKKPDLTLLPPEKGEQVRLLLRSVDGDFLLTDYQSAGKKWLEKNAIITVWHNEVDH